MSSFPRLASGVTAIQYPLEETISCKTGMAKFGDDSEQVWVIRRPITKFTLALNTLSKIDRDRILTFFETTKGSFDSTWDITIGSANYPSMSFDADVIKFTESHSRPGYWDGSISMSQKRQ